MKIIEPLFSSLGQFAITVDLKQPSIINHFKVSDLKCPCE